MIAPISKSIRTFLFERNVCLKKKKIFSMEMTIFCQEFSFLRRKKEKCWKMEKARILLPNNFFRMETWQEINRGPEILWHIVLSAFNDKICSRDGKLGISVGYYKDKNGRKWIKPEIILPVCTNLLTWQEMTVMITCSHENKQFTITKGGPEFLEKLWELEIFTWLFEILLQMKWA